MALRDMGVEMHLGTFVTHVDGEGLDTRDRAGTTVHYKAGTVLWAAGVEGPAVADALAKATGAQRDRAGRIEVEPDLTIAGHPEISVVGDMMSRDRLPGVAEVAMQSGLYAGRRIRHRIASRPVRPFRYYDLGSAAYLARGNAVVAAGPVRFAGFAGWLTWLLIHIAFLTGYRNRVGAVLTWAAAFARDARRERTFTTQQIERMQDIYDPSPAKDRPTAGP
jgi:NADH:quinone reductase (non-electrogenic)